MNLFILLIVFLWFFSLEFLTNVSASDEAEEIEGDIKSIQKKIDAKEKILEENQSNLQVTENQIYKTADLIKKTATEIERKETEIKSLEQRIELNKQILSSYIQEMYYNDQEAVSALILREENFNQYFGNFDQILNAKEKVLAIVSEIEEDHNKLRGAKEELAEKKEEHEDLLAKKEEEKDEIEENIIETQASLSELNEKMNTLRSDLSRILGKAYDTGEIKDAIKFANKITGVRKGFLFGVLSMESGGNPEAGKCTYKNSGMSSARQKYFKAICEELDYDYKKRPVSCSPAGYSGSGGAMGAAQFMPDTWAGYKSKIAKATGHNPPDPWDLTDGVMAMALKLEADGATGSKVRITVPRAVNAEQFKKYPQCSSYKSSVAQKKIKVKGEIYASMRYLGWNCYGYANYAPGIQNLANGYDKL